MESSNDEIKDDLVSHKKGIEHQITQFLGKQNLLIQNLTQQIDGFQRATQTLATDQQTTSRKIVILEEALSIISTQEIVMHNMKNDILAIRTKLELVITRLQKNFIIKKSFKEL